MLGLGAFKPSGPLLGGLLWKIPYRLSRHQKYRHRQRLRHVDSVVETLSAALAKQGTTIKEIERWKAEMPTEAEMEPKDKYTVFARYERKYRKGIHKVPKWTRVSQRVNPPGY
ncbi:mitochondrial ribosomal protein L31-domain-containing protein [Kalaharituber pfeilii]|nr:mitochondrial ribosomal protein L31-domain-containing protein [Kalaharituber pfeilii]